MLSLALVGCTAHGGSDPEPVLQVPAEVAPEPAPQAVRYPGPCRAHYTGQMQIVTDFEYDDHGRLIRTEQVQDNSGGPVNTIEEFSYDDHGRLETRRLEKNGPLAYIQVEHSHYDDGDRVTSVDKTDRDDAKPKWRTIQEYDEFGRLILRQELTVSRGRAGFQRKFIHKDDRLLRELVDNAGKRNWPLTVTYSYDDSDRVVKRVHEWEDRPHPSQIDHFEYDAQSRLVRRIDERPSEDGQGGYSTSVVFEYDEAGNVLVKKAVHDSIGEVTAQTDYSYECWKDAELPEDFEPIGPWEVRTRLDQVAAIWF